MRYASPPSGLPAVSPARGEIGCGVAFANLPYLKISEGLELLISPLEEEMPDRAAVGTS
ncbi:propionyl-coenzyme A carboxylase alpha polypeptide [Mesorhizobium sp. B2-4-19]|nr:propionyl-coenzyme A carboxylase alpha polypeptide [Mesorhizobium sp. B2-4-19]